MTKELKRRIESGEWNDSVLVLNTTKEVREAGGADSIDMYCQKATPGIDGEVHVYGYVKPTETAWCQWHIVKVDSVTRVVH